MAAFELKGFRGERPIVDDGDLNENEASYALDLKIEGGKLVCMREPLSRHTQTVSGSIQSFARYIDGWFEWNVEVDVSPSQVGGDTYDRRIFTGDGAPKVTYNAIAVDGLGGPYPSDAYLLGVPPPGYVDPTYRSGQAASIALVGTATTPSDPAETRFYVLTSIDVFGAEGPPTPISNSVDWRDGQSVDVTIPAAPVGDYNITGWRMYRTATGTDGTDFQYVKDGTSWSTTVNDAVATEALGEVLSTEFYALPNANMVGIEPMPNGYLAGFNENTVYFSEPGYPHAWPISYQQNTKAPIVGLKAMGNNMLLVGQRGHGRARGHHPGLRVETQPAGRRSGRGLRQPRRAGAGDGKRCRPHHPRAVQPRPVAGAGAEHHAMLPVGEPVPGVLRFGRNAGLCPQPDGARGRHHPRHRFRLRRPARAPG
jgi:hypothetical protein